MFRLPSFASPSPRLTEALTDIGKPGGLLDARDHLAAGPVALIVDPAQSINNRDNLSATAGTTFVGQFIDHDITFDVQSRLGRPTAPESVANARAARLDLESVYGGGPVTSPHLYDAADRAKLRVEGGGRFEDLPRTAEGAAIIADPRNDQSIMLAGLHCAVMLFHNRCVDRIRDEGTADTAEVFAAARQLTTWHFQWLVLHEIVPTFIGQAMTKEILSGGRSYYRPSAGAFIPVEFQAGAYRMGHSLVRPSYRANLGGAHGPAFFGFIFDPTLAPSPDPDDLIGGCRAPRRFVGWQTFFDFGDGEVRRSKRIDMKLSTPLFNLPLFAIASGDAPTVLPQRTLLRHVTWMLPSGQAVARAMGAPVLPSSAFSELRLYGLGLESSTPLFYYVLREAEVMEDGVHLGPVGGRIVGEVLIGLLELDPDGFLARPGWRPTLPQRSGAVTGQFTMTDFLAFAGVDPASRGE
ncbi:MAG TPA: peroxidase family protein [Egibacteraceae bacterium]|nr:peroxidase family protein [Egibacteraceae bacterium]